MKSPIDLLSSYLMDLRRLEPDVKGLHRDELAMRRRFEHEGNGFLTITLPSLCDALDEGLAYSKFTCPFGFKRVKGGTIPVFLQGMFCEVFDSITGILKHDANLHIVKCLREFLRMFKKLALSMDEDTHLDSIAKSKFFDVEEKCRSPISFDERQLYIIEQVGKYILPNLDVFETSELHYQHGPGAVVEGLTANQKWFAVADHIDKLEYHGYDYLSWFSKAEPRSSYYRSLSDSARLISVPKNSTSRRTITVEPLLNQFIQQGYNDHLRSNIERCGILSQSLALTDQSKNQTLALEGSRTGKWATLDLSSASDLLSVKIVELVFRARPAFLSGILGCRSTSVTEKETVPLVKFAGMGNATTFPVQSVVFAVLAISALLCRYPPTYRNVKRVARLVRVYGDDIIIPTNKSHLVVDWITSAGLVVNTRKSFTIGNFRESCGLDAFRGVEVTPLYVRCHPINVSKKEPKSLSHYTDLCNQAWLRGLYSLSATLQQIVEEAIRRRLPLVTAKCSGLGLVSRQDRYSFQRWNKHLHRPELKAICVEPVFRLDELDGIGALIKCLSSRTMYVDKKHLSRTPVRFKTKTVLRWVVP